MKSKCLNCGHASDITHGPRKLEPGEKYPEPGQFAICCSCNLIGKFIEDMDLQPLTPDELFKLFIEDENLYFALSEAQYRIRRVKDHFRKSS